MKQHIIAFAVANNCSIIAAVLELNNAGITNIDAQHLCDCLNKHDSLPEFNEEAFFADLLA